MAQLIEILSVNTPEYEALEPVPVAEKIVADDDDLDDDDEDDESDDADDD